ncbi:hypothetical protein ACLUWO_04310 [Pseudoscardovia radai]|uniref:hypothetical protein n=1 Tax=Pseudoscardovia radai TaxID=987066 RepID=UPI003994145C
MKHIKIGGSDLEKVARVASKALRTAQAQQTGNTGSVFVPDGQKDADGKPLGTGTIVTGNGGGIRQWVNDTTVPGTPTGLYATSSDTAVTVAWDGTLDGAQPPADFQRIDILADGTVRGTLTAAGTLDIMGLTVGSTATITAVAYDDAHDSDGNPKPNQSPASQPVTVTVTGPSALQSDLDKLDATLKTLNDTTLPDLDKQQQQLQTDLAQAQKDLDTLNNTTLPSVKSDLAQAQTDIDTLNNTTLPSVKSDLAQAQTDIKGLTGDIQAAQNSADTANSDLTAYITATAKTLEDMQGQIDGSIQTYFNPEPPTTGNEPASKWTSDTTKANHLGDLYYDTITGYCYRWQVYDQEYSWQRITDVDVTKALADAAKAQDTADGKRRVFVATPNPPYDEGDLWVQGSAGDIKVCTTAKTDAQSYAAGDWTLASKYTDDTAARNAQSTADGKNTIIRSTTPPTSSTPKGKAGDLWFVYSGTTCTGLYASDGSAWIAQPLANTAIASLDAGKITTGYLSANRLAAGSISSGKIATGAVTADKIAALAVSSDKLSANAVTADKLAAGAVSSDKIAANAVTAGKIAANAVSAGKIAANSISAAQLISGCVSSDKLAVNSVTASKIATGAVSADKLAANSVTSGKIAAGSVGASQIISGSIVADKIAAQAITSDKLGANAVTAGKLAANAIDGKTITGATIKTTNGRVTISDTGITSTDSNGETVVSIPSDGTGITATGRFIAKDGGAKVVTEAYASPDGSSVGTITDYSCDGASAIKLQAFDFTDYGTIKFYAQVGNIAYAGTLGEPGYVYAMYGGMEYKAIARGEYNGDVPSGNGVHIQFSPHFHDKPTVTITEDYDGIADMTARLFEPIVHGVDHAGFWVRLLRRDTHEWATDTQKMHFHWTATAIG